jgi:hypothetical protein
MREKIAGDNTLTGLALPLKVAKTLKTRWFF